MQIWAESGKSALPICNYSQILYQFLTFTQNLKRSHGYLRRHSTAAAYCIQLFYRMVTDICCSQEPVFLFQL